MAPHMEQDPQQRRKEVSLIVLLVPVLGLALAWTGFLLSPDFLKRSTQAVRIEGKGALIPQKSAELLVYSKGPSQEGVGILLKDGDHVKSEEGLHLAYYSKEGVCGAIFSINSLGAVSWYLPEEGLLAKRIPITAGKVMHLPGIYRLDDAAEEHSFFFFSSKVRLEPEQILPGAIRIAKNPKDAVSSARQLWADSDLAIVRLKIGK